MAKAETMLTPQRAYGEWKKRFPYKCFPVNFAKFFKNTFFTEHLQMTASVDRNSFKAKQRSYQEMLYVICDLPISDISCEITWKFNKILERNQWKSFF